MIFNINSTRGHTGSLLVSSKDMTQHVASLFFMMDSDVLALSMYCFIGHPVYV